jgi:hypothetical protein
VSHDQPFKALQDVPRGGNYLGRLPSFSWALVVCLKHEGITDSVRESLKMSVKTHDSWSMPALSTHPDNPSSPGAFVSVDLFKGFVHIGYRERYHTVIQNSWCSRACFSVACLKASIKGI